MGDYARKVTTDGRYRIEMETSLPLHSDRRQTGCRLELFVFCPPQINLLEGLLGARRSIEDMVS